MSVLAVCTNIKVYFSLYILLQFAYHDGRVGGAEYVYPYDKASMYLLANTGWDIIKATFSLIEGVENLKQKHLNKPSFEIGYLMFNVFEKYRKMVDRQNTSMVMKNQLFTMETVMYLEEVENLYWEVEHITNMMHEIERKYGVKSPLDSKYREMTSEELREIQAKSKAAKEHQQTIDMIQWDWRKRVDKNPQKKTIMCVKIALPKPKSTCPTGDKCLSASFFICDIYFFLDFTLEPSSYEDNGAVHTSELKRVLNDTIYKELSWSVKLLLLKDLMKSDDKGATTMMTTMTTPMPLFADPDRSPGPEPAYRAARRMPMIQALVIKRRQDDTTKVLNDDDNSMRLKLFRLMYETIKDSDVKCKRAELIRSHYENSPSFEIGYLMGDVMDKYNIMSDISMTLNRLFHEWKPIEHINAYEQISNQAIEINHLIDMMKGIGKKKKNETQNHESTM